MPNIFEVDINKFRELTIKIKKTADICQDTKK